MWQEFASDGVQFFEDRSSLTERKQQIEGALSGLSLEISKTASQINKSGLERALELRARPSAEGKSLYECLNQLIHYWYCCSAGQHLFDIGARNIEMRPTGHANSGRQGIVYDLEVRDRNQLLVCAEVFCVSDALWGQKISGTAEKLVKPSRASATTFRFIFCNARNSTRKITEIPGIVVYAVTNDSNVSLLKSNDQRIVAGNTFMLPTHEPQ